MCHMSRVTCRFQYLVVFFLQSVKHTLNTGKHDRLKSAHCRYDYIMKHEGGLEESRARKYFRQIVTAITYCHKLHVVHR